MNLSKKEEKELLKVYETWWDSYLNGDIKTYNYYLDDDFRFVGSTDGEEFLNRKDTTAFFEATADQLAGKAKLENVIRSIETVDGMVLITDLGDAFILDKGNWVYYARFRFTSLVRNTSKGWRFFYQHFSTPDLKAQEGETLGLEKVTAENLQLRTAIKRRTAELELKNRELEIEASLERVRARAMAMKKSDELSDLVNTVFEELTRLDFALSWCMINIIDEPSLSNMVWGANTEKGKPPESYYMKFEDYRFHHEMLKAYQDRLPKWVFELKGKEKKEYDDYLFGETEFRRVSDSVQKEMRTSKKYVASFTFSDFGGLQTVGEVPLSDASLDILARFGKVFDLTYTRFNDLKKAEAQARESRIELALERVRARTMAMQDSSELQEVINLLHKEFKGLEVAITGGVFIAINDEIKEEINCWGSGGTTDYMERVHIPFLNSRIYTGLIKNIQKGPGFFTEVFSNKLKKDFFKHLFKQAPYSKTSDEHQKEVMNRAGGYTRSCSVSKNTSIFIINHHGVKFSNEENEILRRFGNVFEQTYTRFLDLKKAEAQARESRIELALERVRARTMAMQQSEELGDVATVLFKELNELVENLWTCGFVLCERDRNEDEWWLSTEGGFIPPLLLPNVGDDTHHNIYEAWKNGASYHTEQLEGDALQEHYDWLMTIPVAKETFDDMKASGLERPSWQKLHCAYFSYGYLVMITRVPCPEEEIFKRFAKVFDQTYTRFLDLQKSEKQARESQIQLSLERVRARSLAMKSADELHEVLSVLFRQFDILGINPVNVFLSLFDREERTTTYRASGKSGKRIPGKQVVDIDSLEAWTALFDKWKNDSSDAIEVIYYPKEVIPEIFNLFTETFSAMPEKDRMTADDFPNGGYSVLGYTPFGYLGYDHICGPTEEEKDILTRICVEFTRVYQRFLDLQKAEAQAREAQIELALERVRARTMAMQKSEELADVATVLFQQVKELGIEQWTCGFNIWETGDTHFTFYPGGPDGEILDSCEVPLTEHPIFRQFDESKKRGDELFVYEKEGEVQADHYKYMHSLPGIGDMLQGMLDKGLEFPSFQIDHVANFLYGNLIFITYEPFPEMHDVFKRFAKVFEQTYTRFLDLQKAESQAREAQIEAALERVRSASMAMHQTEDIGKVVVVYFEQLKVLKVSFAQAWITILHLEEGYFDTWFSPIDGIYDAPQHFQMPSAPFEETTIKSWLEGVPFSYLSIDDKEELEQFYKACDEMTGSKYFTNSQQKLQLEKLEILEANHKYGMISKSNNEAPKKEEKDLLYRFGKVFEQTYTRFLDLQKAEVQAREAQIEAALERVRSRSMAMHNSNELKEVVKVIFDQMAHLKINADHAGIVVDYEPKKDFHFWVADHQDIPARITVPYLDLVWDRQFTEAKKKGKDFFSTQLNFDEKNSFYKKLLPHIENLSKEARDFYFNCPGLAASTVIQKDIGLYIENFSGIPFSEEENSILMRFGKVFQQTYTRFLDLQKVEAQAREAQIEGALERVRSRTTGMQKSEELREVIQVIHDQLIDLNFQIDAAGFTLDYHQNNDWNTWIANKSESLPSLIYIPYIDHPQFNYYKSAKEKGLDFLANTLSFEEKNSIFEYMFGFMGDYPQEEKDELLGKPGLAISQVFLKNISLWIYNLDAIPYSDEDNSTLMRFGKVFQQTYTRFLDLQKAEKQAREAQIEAALEKVRSRSLAMHKPEELQEVVAVVAEKLQELGVIFDAGGVILCTYFPDNKDVMHWISAPDFSTSGCYLVPYFDNPIFNDAWDSKIKGDAYFSKEFSKKAKNDFFKHAFDNSDYRDFPDEYKQHVLQAEKHTLTAAWSKNSAIIIPSLTGAVPSERDAEIMKRFAKVFEQAYIRFMDLQKAEAQAREAQIEAALERTRNQSMQMQHSDEIKDLSKIFHEQLIVLNIPSEFSYVWLPEEDKQEHMFWATWSETTKGSTATLSKSVVYPLDKTEPYTAACYKAWASEEPVHESNIPPKETAKFFDTWKELLKGAKKLKARYFPEGIYYAEAYMKYGCFGINIRRALQNDEADILHRFAVEFERAYTRFLDLQKAEAQAREAEIEAALERVRSQTMAMHDSQDVGKTVVTFFDEVMKLGLNKSIRCGIGILEDREKMETWSATSHPNGDVDLQVGLLDMKRHPLIKGLETAWKNKEDGYSSELIGEDVVRYYEQLIEEPDYPFHVDLDNLSDIEYHRSFFFSSGIIFTFTKTPLSEEAALVLKRFASVFGQTYRRYLDLQKAEAQAKEAQIEAALEKVRSRTMAMQSSTELQEAANLLFLEIQALGINAWSAGYNILSDDKTSSTCWMSSEGELQDPFPLYFTEEASFIEMGRFLKSKEDFYVQELEGKAVEQHYGYMKSLPELADAFKHLEDAGLSLPTYQINHLCKFSSGFLLFITYESVPEAHDIFKRFTKVFEQTYTRFLDLQKAENQSKESQIELALERVRASTMAMHKSEQLAETAEVLFEQFDLLGIIPDRISIAIYNDKKRIFELWATDQSGAIVNHVHDFSIEEPTCMAKTYKAWKEGEETFVIDLKGKDLKNWVRYVKEEAKMKIDASKFKGRRVQHSAFFSQGYLLLSSHLPVSDDTMQLLVRFAKVFQQTYTRFLDLQKAEMQAREAIKRASVDRVRAEIASMRTATDLERITPLVWNELTTLDVPFIRCGVFIMDEERQQVQTHLSTPDGKAIASFELPFENTEPLDQLLSYWYKKEMYTDYWDESAFKESTKILMQRGAISSAETYVTENQPTSLHLHFLPFLQGMLYVGSEISLNEDELNLVQNLAEAFSTAYSRYEDFNKLEQANKKIEKTLVDLKQTQTQLIQSEKMASLGELTAGIAHEIQNPLNFVNNFSEVSQELMQEMHEELDKGDLAEALEIGNDIEQNLEKIKHHGQRASEIVKGMLQHSRSSSGVKELTDVNALTDEYLRLAYHGLRAKDKSFNAKMETEFDDHLEKINVIPQDIGRVILNLITNAFYAVNEKKNEQGQGYEPVVNVCTKKIKEGIEISVKDNGNGIPQKVLDKIFQPFFTTKPTGQGTGLGLSLSYDIIKAHGGELKVETKENEGTKFTITLSIN